MTREQERQLDPNICAVLQRCGSRWRALVARIEPAGRSPSPSPPRIIEAREFASASGATSTAAGGEVESWLDEHRAGQVVGVVHAPSVICRTCALPDSSPEQLEAAMRLQAEAHLLGVAPVHRVGMAVMAQASGESGRVGLILAWPETASDDDSRYAPPLSRNEIDYAPDLAGLAALVGDQRPPQPLLWIDRTDGSLAMALSHPNGVAFRGLREDADDEQTWRTSVGRAVAETALNFGYSGSFVETTVQNARQWMDGIESGDARCNLPQELIDNAAAKFEDASSDPEWWSKFGVLAGVVLARAGSLAPLTKLRASIPDESPSILGTIVNRLSRPATARVAVIVCLVLLMFGPLAFNAARVGALKLRHSDLDQQVTRYHEVNNKLAIYRQLRNSSWSMTKVLSDIMNNTPQGIELEYVRVNHNRIINVRGKALRHGGLESREVVTTMRSLMRDSGIFDNFSVNWGDSDAFGGIQFDLSARIIDPFHVALYPEDRDFGVKSLAERRYGPLPSPSDALSSRVQFDGGGTALNDEPRQDEIERTVHRDEQPQRDELDPTARADAGIERRSERSDRPPRTDRLRDPDGPLIPEGPRDEHTSRAGEIPPPLSESQIRSMSREETLEALQRVSRATGLARTGDDEELRERLRNERQMLMAQLRGDL